MNRPWRILVALLGGQAAIAAAAAVVELAPGCGDCRTRGISLGLAGFAFYSGLFLAALYAGPTRFIFSAILFAFGMHVALGAKLLAAETLCWVCVAAGAMSFAMATLAVACDRANLGRMVVLLPWAALLILAWAAAPPAAVADTPGASGVQVTVFTQPDCPYCDELRQSVLPRIEQEFGPRLQVSFRPAEDAPSVRRTPTLVVSAGGRRTQTIEGLPSIEALRRTILDAEGRP